jgi:hypothetical protein
MTHEGLDTALRLLEQSLTLDPGYAPALSVKAQLIAHSSVQGWIQPVNARHPEMLELVRAAVRSDPQDPDVLAGAAHMLAWAAGEFDEAHRLCDLACRLGPNSAFVWSQVAAVRFHAGRPHEAASCFRHALDLDPIDPMGYYIRAHLAFALINIGEEAQAIALASRVTRENPRFVFAWRALIAALGLAGRVEEGRVALQTLLALDPSFCITNIMARTLPRPSHSRARSKGCASSECPSDIHHAMRTSVALALSSLLCVAWLHARAETRIVAMAGTPAPGGGVFGRFGVESQPVAAPVNARGDVAFFASLARSPADEALFVSRGGHIARIVAIGDPVPDGGALTGFTGHPALAIAASGSVVFGAQVTGGRASQALFVWASGRLNAIVQSGTAAPGIAGGALADFAAPVINDAGDVAFFATVRRGRETQDAIYLRTKGQLRRIAAAGDQAPGGGTFSAMATPAINNKGVVAFAALVEQGERPAGLFVAADGKLRRVIGAGDAVPGGGMFTRLSEQIGLDDAGHVVFTAFLRDAPSRGAVFLDRQPIASIGGTAPGGGRFVSFGEAPSLAPDGTVAFVGAVDGEPGMAAFSFGPGGLQRRVAVDDEADGHRIAYFPINPTVAAGVGGRVTVQVGLLSGSEQVDAIVLAIP